MVGDFSTTAIGMAAAGRAGRDSKASTRAKSPGRELERSAEVVKASSRVAIEASTCATWSATASMRSPRWEEKRVAAVSKAV